MLQIASIKQNIIPISSFNLQEQKAIASTPEIKLPSAPASLMKVYFGATSAHENIGTEEKEDRVVHATCFFRFDDNPEYVDNLIKKFPNGVKIYDYACSDGSEAYSIAMLLIDKLEYEKTKEKYLIIAKDIGPKVIAQANDGVIGITNPEEISRHLKSTKFDDYFTKMSPSDESYYRSKYGLEKDEEDLYYVSDKLRSCVKFSKANILEDSVDPTTFESSNGQPLILLFRYALYHLSGEQQEELIKNLYNNPSFAEGSICDFSTGIFGPKYYNENMFTACDSNFKKCSKKNYVFYIKNNPALS